MSSNKRIRKSPPRTARALVAETKPAPRRAQDLKKEMHRLEVEIASAGRFASDRRPQADSFAPATSRQKGYGVQQRLTYSQAQKRRTRWVMQAAMFLTSTCLLAGAGAWLFRFWQSVH